MKTKRFKNPTPRTYEFSIYGQPGQAPTQYKVGPGEECEVPLGYCQGDNSFLSRRAPGLVPFDEEPKAEEPKAEEPKAEEPKEEAPKAEEPKVEPAKVEEPMEEPNKPFLKPNKKNKKGR